MRSKNIFLFVIVFLICVILAGCGSVDEKNGGNDKINNDGNSISNLKIVDVNSKSRPYAVMINNLAAARPFHSGLQDAYIVYEIIVEGGITRLMALYKDKDTSRIGSIRSSRHYYLDYALENDAIYVHFGWSPQAQSDISKLKINNINGLTYDGSTFFRDTSLGVDYEHTAFTSMDKLEERAKKLNYRTESNEDLLLNYSVKEINLNNEEDSKIANEVKIKYSSYITSEYSYNSNDKLYYRSINGKEHSDYVTKKQYTTKNIIVAFMENSYIENDDKGRQELDNIGTGDGYYITNGYAIPIKWSKSSRSAQTVYTKLNGEEIDVNDGNTYIQIAPLNSLTIK